MGANLVPPIALFRPRHAVVGLIAALSIALALSAAQAPIAHAGGCENADATPRTISTGQAEKAVRCLINKKRARRGLKRVKNRPGLAKAADRHSVFMRDNRCFAHQCNGEANLSRRLERAGYLPCGCSYLYGETIAWGHRTSGTPRQVVKAWMKSPGHKAILVDRRFREIGVGAVWGSPHDPAHDAGIYTADFGVRKG